MSADQVQQLATALGTVLASLGALCLMLRRFSAARFLIIVGIAVAVFGPWLLQQWPAIALDAEQWWHELPRTYQVALMIASFLLACLLALLLSLSALRLIARPFLGRNAADSMAASVGADAVRFLMGGFLIRLYRWIARAVSSL
ncbi:hypothetical protein ABT392_07935 [Paucibacter sp. JuS9]|uniref:hypothetical protein n=1 Tax=Paucibacter sp. JuS9 TaxID=3228748 RepID=UPI003756F56A